MQAERHSNMLRAPRHFPVARPGPRRCGNGEGVDTKPFTFGYRCRWVGIEVEVTVKINELGGHDCSNSVGSRVHTSKQIRNFGHAPSIDVSECIEVSRLVRKRTGFVDKKPGKRGVGSEPLNRELE